MVYSCVHIVLYLNFLCYYLLDDRLLMERRRLIFLLRRTVETRMKRPERPLMRTKTYCWRALVGRRPKRKPSPRRHERMRVLRRADSRRSTKPICLKKNQ